MRPALVMGTGPTYTTPFYADPWPLDSSSSSPASSPQSNGSLSNSSSSTSSTCCHVLSESVFAARVAHNSSASLDPYFGKQDVARLCNSYLVKTFNCLEETETSKRLGQPQLPLFIAQIIHIADVPYSAVSATLILLQRFRSVLPINSSSLGLSGHRLFLAAFIIACQEQAEANAYSSTEGRLRNAQSRSATYWSEMSLFPERDVDDMHAQLYDELDGNVNVFPSYAAAMEKLKNPITIRSFWDDSTSMAVSDSEASSMSSLSMSMGKSEEVASSLSEGKKQTRNRSVGTKIASLFKKRS